MPFPMIPAALGVCFLLVWALIGGMIFRDSQLAVENEREANWNILPLAPQQPQLSERSQRLRTRRSRRRGGERTVRAAS
jgi:hypothetical protein